MSHAGDLIISTSWRPTDPRTQIRGCDCSFICIQCNGSIPYTTNWPTPDPQGESLPSHAYTRWYNEHGCHIYQLSNADRVRGTLSNSCSYSTSTLGPPVDEYMSMVGNEIARNRPTLRFFLWSLLSRFRWQRRGLPLPERWLWRWLIFTRIVFFLVRVIWIVAGVLIAPNKR